MSYRQVDDSGQFNESVVYLPLRFTQKSSKPISKHNNPEQVHLGIYEHIKLTSLIKNRQGKVIELVSLDHNSSRTFVNEEGEELLRQYPTNQIAFVMVVGNQNVGKSFFCDKVLNLSEIRGNHFCRKKSTGINIWTSPYEKGDLKIFLLEISGCSIGSEDFKILLTYSIMIGSAFVIIDDLKPKEVNALQQFDFVLSDLIDKITPSKIERGEVFQNRNIFMPEFFYFLKRRTEKQNQNLSVVSNFIEEKLPDALVATFKGDQNELIHLPFLDVKCVNEEYIRRTSHIFTQLYDVITEKKYNDLTLTGSIILKIIKYIENYLNNNRHINIEELYERIIEDLYQSAYNYCILSYHEEMERQFQDEQPKSLDQLLLVFEDASHNMLEKFQEFTLDEKFHRIYQEKLEKHIDQKEIMVLDINKLKTQRIVHSSFDAKEISDYQGYKRVVDRVRKMYPTLNHGQTEELGKVGAELFVKMKNVDYKSLKQIERLNEAIEAESGVLAELKEKNSQKSKERSLVNKQNEELYQYDKQLQARKRELHNQIDRAKSMGHSQPDEFLRERQHYQELIKRNNVIISQLRQGPMKKTKEISIVESKIEETRKNNARLEKMLEEMRNVQREQAKQSPPKKQASKAKK